MLVRGAPGPDDPDFQRGRVAEGPPPIPGFYRIGPQIRHVGWNRIHRRAEHMRQIHQRQLQVERRQRGSAGHHGDALQLPQQRHQGGLYMQNDGSTPGRNHRQVTHELQDITDALFGEQQQRAAGKRLALPLGDAEIRHRLEQGHVSAPPAIIGEAVPEIAAHQQEVRMIEAHQRIFRCKRNRTMRRRKSLVDVSVVEQDRRAIAVYQRMLRRKRDGTVRDGKRLVNLSGLVQNHGQIGMAVGIAGVRSDCAAIRRDRSVDVISLLENEPPIDMRLRIARLKRQCLLAGGGRLVESAEIAQAAA